MVRTTAEWWASDSIAILTFTPALIVYVIPRMDHGLKPPTDLDPAESRYHWPSRSRILEMSALLGIGALAIWIVFGLTSATPYQPLYLLFVPLIWISVRYGLRGSALSVSAPNLGLTFAAWITQAPRGSMPRLQFAMIALGLTGLCLGAIVLSAARRTCAAVRPTCKRHREWLGWVVGRLRLRQGYLDRRIVSNAWLRPIRPSAFPRRTGTNLGPGKLEAHE